MPDSREPAGQEGRTPLPGLSPRERQVVDLILAGCTYAQVARRLGISLHTVDTHLRRARRKTGAENTMKLALLAVLQADRRPP